jgi:Ca-dependent carbohydrate-binding module xylan-binding
MKEHSGVKRLFIIIIVLVVVILAGYFSIKPAFKYLSGYLSKSEQVKGNILIVEGWLPDYALRMAEEEYRKNGYEYIITTGLKSVPEYYLVAENGYLIFYPRDKLSGLNQPGNHSVEINAYSELDGVNRAHFNVYVNDSLKADFLAEKRKKNYNISWKGNLSRIDSILIEFTNDALGDFGDRNLYVKEIVIDHKIKIPYNGNSDYDIGKLNGIRRVKNNFNSSAEFARNRLLSLGLDSSSVIAVPARKVQINRTLTSALAFRDWLNSTSIKIKGINIISLGTHSRRTWMTYNKILNEKYGIGIIALPDIKYNNSRISRILKTVRQTLGIVYYWLILIPY